MVFFEAANLINSRPIGVITGSDPTQPASITPNHLILGRATSEAIIGATFDQTPNTNKRLKFLQTLVDDWWKKWYETVLPSLVPCYKWNKRFRNVQVGDICLIKYKNELKGRYRLGKVSSIKIGDDGLVRTITLLYRNEGEKTLREVERPIHGVAVIVPIEEQDSSINSDLNADAAEFKPIQDTKNKYSFSTSRRNVLA